MKTLVVCGATATGKSDLAFEIAKRLKAEIINFDSIQFYKDFNIGAAKPPQSYLDQIPHHFVGVVDPTINYTAGDFRRDSLKLLKSLEKKQWTVLVGGTGFYLQALIRGMYGS